VAIAHNFGLSGHAEFDCATKALSDVRWFVVHDTLRQGFDVPLRGYPNKLPLTHKANFSSEIRGG
jgi:hypothetical protein